MKIKCLLSFKEIVLASDRKTFLIIHTESYKLCVMFLGQESGEQRENRFVNFLAYCNVSQWQGGVGNTI